MDLHVAVPEAHVTKEVLEPALEAVTQLNEHLLEAGEVPTAEDAIEHDGIRWKPEPPGAERFDHAGLVHRRKHGDCDDLAPWHAASLRVTGEDPGAQAIVRPSGPGMWHAIVRRSDGSIDDPSKWAGMGQKQGVHGAVLRPMFDVRRRGGVNGAGPFVRDFRPGIGIRRVEGRGYVARVDLPWAESTDVALSTLHRAPVAAQSIVGAIMGACLVGQTAGVAYPEDVRALHALAGLLEGEHPGSVAERLGEEAVQRAIPFCAPLAHVVGFNFGKFLKSALPIASTIASFIPGVGPVLKTASDVAMMAMTASEAHGGAPQILSELAAVVAT